MKSLNLLIAYERKTHNSCDLANSRCWHSALAKILSSGIYQGQAPLQGEELISHLQGKQGVLCLLHNRFDAHVLASCPELKIISNMAVGYDNIDLAEATRRGIAITNTPGVLSDATADLTWALLLAVVRRVVEGDHIVRSGAFQGWDPLFLLGWDLKGKTLGIVGAGRIGTAVAERSLGWKMRILYVNRKRNNFLEEKLGAQKVDLPTLLKESDFITLHVPLTPETHHLIGQKELQLMKPTAFLINTARGPVVDEKALYQALKEKRIAGAALDVFENEPHITPGLADLPNVVLTPHIGSATVETRNRMAEMAAQNLIRFFQGQPPVSIVNPEVLSHRTTS